MTPRDDPAAFNRALGQAVRHYRFQLGVSQEDLSFDCELDRTYISGIERGVRNPTVQTLLRICRALGVRPSTLMRRTEDIASRRR